MIWRKGKRRRLIWVGLGGLAVAGALGWYVLPWCVPLPSGLDEVSASPRLLDRHGEALHHLTLPDFTRRTPVGYDDLPSDLIACTLAAEDKRFRRHGGVDLLATARAGRDWLMEGRQVSGASTVTQQLVKLGQKPQSRTLKVKLVEALQARQLEMRWSKDEILAGYFNRLNYGNHRIGPVEAARFYFQKPIAQLSLAECALLAGLPQAPSRLNPIKHPERAVARRGVVLDRLARLSDDSRIAMAKREPLVLRPLKEKTLAPWLPSLAPGEAGEVHTTLDREIQDALESIVADELERLKESNLQHAAVVVLDNERSEILGLVSSGNWDDPRGGQINGALTPRSPGSALKPFTYMLAFERGGRHPGSIVADIPTRIRTIEGLDAPENFDRAFRGPVTLRQALACSLNVPAMRELNRLGGPEPLHELLVDLGFDSMGDNPVEHGLGLTLGNAPVTLLELAEGYATLARGGLHLPATLGFESHEGKRCFSEGSAWLITDVLADPVARASSFGRRGPLELPFHCAVKTGTSSDFRDNWCVGYTSDYTVAVWAGNFDHSPMKGVSGVDGAGPIFRRAMERLHRDKAPEVPVKPGGLIQVRIDPRCGKLASGSHTVDEWVPVGLDLLPARADDFDEEGRLFLDDSYAEWLASDDNQRRSEFSPEPARPAETPLRVLAPRPGTVYLLDPELPNGGRLRLSTNLPSVTTWHCESLSLDRSGAEAVALLEAGEHQLVLTDKRNGSTREMTITVEER